jgi:PHD/YefM family antitoxin component YafN of YafNO toxin-antitoxin module
MEKKQVKMKKPAVLLSADEYENMQETLEVLSDSELLHSISKALKEPSSKRKSHSEVFNESLSKRN